MSWGKLLSKPNAESVEASSTGHFVTQVEQEMHVLDGDYQSWKRSLSVVLGGGLEAEVKAMTLPGVACLYGKPYHWNYGHTCPNI